MSKPGPTLARERVARRRRGVRRWSRSWSSSRSWCRTRRRHSRRSLRARRREPRDRSRRPCAFVSFRSSFVVRTRRYVVPARFGSTLEVSHPMDVLEIAPGLWRWTAFHEEWNEDVGCVYVETEDGVVLIDPLVPSDDTAKFWKALDRDVKRHEGAGSRLHHGVLARAQRRRDARAVRRPHLGAVGRQGGDRPSSRRRSPTRSARTIRCRAVSRRTGPLGRPRSCTGSPSTRRSSRATS